METNVLITTEGYIVMCQSKTQPIYEIIWIVNILRIPTILSIKQAYRPIVISVPIFFLLLTACYHIPPFTFQYKVECFVIFCHHSILSTIFFLLRTSCSPYRCGIYTCLPQLPILYSLHIGTCGSSSIFLSEYLQTARFSLLLSLRRSSPNPFNFNRFTTLATSQRLAEINVPIHILVLCRIKSQLVIYLTIEIVGFGDKLSLAFIRTRTSVPTIRCSTFEFWSYKRL